MIEKVAPADFLRYYSNSESPLIGDPSIEAIKEKLKPKFPWIFDAELSSDNFEEKYELVGSEILGQGLQAEVKTAINKSTGMKVACKCFKRQPPGQVPADDTTIFTMPETAFLRELYCSTLIPEGPGFVKILGCYLRAADMVIVLSLHGASLHSIRSQGQFPYERTRHHARGMLATLRALTENGIWHCDAVLQNWLLAEKETNLVLVDFGFSFSSNRRVHNPIHPWTVTSVPPERHHDGWFFPEKSMVWTLGDNVYRMMTGSPVFFATEPLSVEQKKEVFAKEYQINQDWPEEIREFLQAAFQPEDSRPTLKELLSLKLLQ